MMGLNSRGGEGMANGPMSALTIRQPYAWLIVNGHKDIENRTWKPAAARIGQRFWVHASQRRMTKADYANFVADMETLRIRRYPKSRDDFAYGAMVYAEEVGGMSWGTGSRWDRGNAEGTRRWESKARSAGCEFGRWLARWRGYWQRVSGFNRQSGAAVTLGGSNPG